MLDISEISVDGNFSLKDYLMIKHINDEITASPIGILGMRFGGTITSSSTNETSNDISITNFLDWDILFNSMGKNSDLKTENGLLLPGGTNIVIFSGDLLLRNNFYEPIEGANVRRIRLAMHRIFPVNLTQNTMPDIWTKSYECENKIFQADHVTMICCQRFERPQYIKLDGAIPYSPNAGYNNIQFEHSTLIVINFNVNADD